MLQDQPIHVHDVQRPIGSFTDHRGPKPMVRAGNKLRLQILGMPGADERKTGVIQHISADQMVRRLADQQAVELTIEPGHGRTGRRENMSRPSPVEPTHRSADREDSSVSIQHRTHRLSHPVCMLFQIPHGHVIMPAQGAVIVSKPIAVVIPPFAILRTPGFKPELARDRMKAEIVRAQFDLGSRFQTSDVSAAVAICTVKPTIQPPRKAIHQMLRIARSKAGKPSLAPVTHAITICILGV